jgi:hypothetical protein
VKGKRVVTNATARDNEAGLVVLLCDRTQQHVAIEVAPMGTTESELIAIAKATSDRLGHNMFIHVVLPVADHPRAIEQARALLRYSPAKLAA